MYTRIVVPLDGSDLAAAALSAAEELARLAGVPIHLVRVLDTAYFAKMSGYPVYGTFIEVNALMESLRNDEAVAAAHLWAVKREIEGRGLTAFPTVSQHDALLALGFESWLRTELERQTAQLEARDGLEAVRTWSGRSRATLLVDPSALGRLRWLLLATPGLPEPAWLDAAGR